MPLAYIHFEPCPKCSETNTPEIHVTGTFDEGPKYQVACRTCHYEQRDAYESVKECAKAWNKESNEAWGYINQLKWKRVMQQFDNFN